MTAHHQSGAYRRGQSSVDDLVLTCRQCGRRFSFSAGEQAFYLEHGYRPPTRCPECRDARRAVAAPDQIEPKSVRRPMFAAVCSECGEPTNVPFAPQVDRPVYCQACFSRRRAAR
jgi:CxxC-x17-CxxC domain-containing protein